MIRAKFRCLEVIYKYDGMVNVKLGPVKRGTKDPENDVFWKYTPSGEMLLFFNGECDFQWGAYYYIDFEGPVPQGEKTWELTRRDEQKDSLYVEFSWHREFDYKNMPSGLIGGTFKMGLSDQAEAARAQFGVRGSHWRQTVTLAEPNDGNKNLYG